MKLTIRDLELKNRRVLVRVDFNVPLDNGRVTDETRLRETLPTLEFLLVRGAKAVLCSHLGRPKGKPDARYSLRPVAERLRMLLGQRLTRNISVGFCPQTVGLEAEEMARSLDSGAVLLLENLRFQPQEEANDVEFARKLAALGDFFVNDAFGSAHRAHASTVGVTKFAPKSAAGLLMEKELEYLGKALHSPEHPYVVILGGAKIADKIPVIENLAKNADTFLVGGGMAYTFLAAQKKPIGESLFEPDKVQLAAQILEGAQKGRFRLLLPVDHVVAKKLEPGAVADVVGEIPAGAKAFDIGPRTCRLYADQIRNARMIVWNGPMGVFEVPPFNEGTEFIAHAVGASDAVSIVGGGDSVAAVQAAGEASNMTHISTGGGASLEFLGGKELPGVAALTDK
jgi:phosphoglycerate kinase